MTSCLENVGISNYQKEDIQKEGKTVEGEGRGC